jgi:hypothetical protein
MADADEVERLRADLLDDLFMCYAVVGPEDGEPWRIARRAYMYATQCNLYRFDGKAALDEFLDKKLAVAGAVAFTFSRSGAHVKSLTRKDAQDLDTVLAAFEEALGVDR